jgi:hypothetical protein
MAVTVVRGGQVKDGTIQRADLDITTVGQAVIAKVVQGAGVTLTSTGGDAGTGDVTIKIDQSVDHALAASQTIILDTATTNAGVNCLVLGANTTGTPANNLGAGLNFRAETSTTVAVDQATIASGWSDVTHATRTAYLDFSLVNNATATASKMRLFGSGALSVGATTDPAANGIINVATGFRIANAAASGKILIGNGTNYIASTPTWPTTAGTAGNFLTSDGTNWLSKTPASYQGGSVTTAGTVSTGGVMAGLAGSITPGATGRILITVCGYLSSSLAGAFTGVGLIRYGTGTAPAHGAALTGTAVGAQSLGHSTTANFTLPFSISAVVTGLTLGTAYWLDVVYASNSASSTAKLSNATICAMEF